MNKNPVPLTPDTETLIDEVVAANPTQVKHYQCGIPSLAGFFVGQVLARPGSHPNIATLTELVRRKLDIARVS